MLSKDQNQNIGNDATAIQAGGNVTVVNVGVTVSEARQIALDVAKATFYELTGTAKEVAIVRVEEITDQAIKKIEKDFPAGLQKAKDPDFQYALYTVQKEYARTGDKDLGDLLVGLLVDRSKQEQRDILQIVLNESLTTVPKLTDTHLAALAVVFLFKHTQDFDISNHQMFGDYLDKHLLPFVSKLSKSDAVYLHLQFSGCGSIGFGDGRSLMSIGCGKSLERILGTYQAQGLFLKGQGVFLKALDHGKMSESEIREKLIAIRPYMAEVCDIWTNSPMSVFNLTSVGKAIGHANIKRLIGNFTNLAIWIN